MELRGFGRNKSRTWCVARSVKLADLVVVVVEIATIGTTLVTISLNVRQFFDPLTSPVPPPWHTGRKVLKGKMSRVWENSSLS